MLLRNNDKRFVHAQIFYRHIFAKQKCAGEAFAKQKDVLLQVCLARMCRQKDPDHHGGDWDFFLITNWN